MTNLGRFPSLCIVLPVSSLPLAKLGQKCHSIKVQVIELPYRANN